MKADLHIHSNFSDGDSSPEKIVETAIEKGIDCIAIADHRETKGSIRAMKYGFDRHILVVPAIEIYCESGDILGLNVKKAIPDGFSAKETIKEIRKQNGLAVIPHAFHWPTNHFLGGEKEILRLKPDAIEVFNASSVYNYANKKAFDFARENNFGFSAGSDAHRAEFIGRGYIEISGNISSTEELLEIIRRGDAKSGGDKLNYRELFRNFKNSDAKGLFKSLFLDLKRKCSKIK